MGLREQLDEVLQPSIDGLREAGVRELQLQPEEEGGAVALAGDGFTLVLHDESAPPFAPILTAGAAPVPSIEASLEVDEPEPSPEPPAPDVKPKPSAVAKRSVKPKTPATVAERDAAKRCGGTYARHSWTREGAGPEHCRRCGAERPLDGPVPVTTEADIAAFSPPEVPARAPAPVPARETSTPRSAVDVATESEPPTADEQFGRVMNADQPTESGVCPRCERAIERVSTPKGPRLECKAVPRGCGWREWQWVTG